MDILAVIKFLIDIFTSVKIFRNFAYFLEISRY